jgi:hypothetical protein
MAKQYYFEELDDASQEYLQKVRQREGEGFAGVFIGSSNWLPLVGLITGLVVIGVTMWFTLPPLGHPLNTAMLQVAGFLLGGWMIVAALRVWAAAGGRHYAGHFVFADALNLWEASGPIVNVTRLDTIIGATGLDNFNEGAYQNTVVTIELAKQQHSVTISSMLKAAELIAFCNALAQIRGGGTSMSPAVLGQTAMAMAGMAADEQGLPVAMAVDDDGIPTARLADDVERPRRRAADGGAGPPSPERTGPARSGIIAYIVIVVLAVLGVFILKPLNEVWHDHAWYNFVKDKEPPELRAYLLDPYCTRHRDKVTELLKGFYQPVVDRLENAGGDADKELAPEFVLLVKDLQAAMQPLVSLSVKEELHVQGGEDFNRVPNAEKSLTNALYNVFTYNRPGDMRHVPGNKLIDTVKPPEDAKPILEVSYRFERDKGRDTKLTWTVRLRHKVTQDVAKTKTWTVGGNWAPEQFQTAVDDGIRQTMTKLTGRAHWDP